MSALLFILSICMCLSCCLGNLQPQEGCEHGMNCTGSQQAQFICPAGHFCLNGEPSPVPCPEGTFRLTGSAPSFECLPCPVNFFNAKRGQEACFPCGSEAEQPKEGQKTCTCLREGRVFQPSDAQCPCAPGYESSSEDRRWDCVKQAYDICRDAAVRNQEGQCLSKEEWASYCSDKICTSPQDYQDYDKVLGLCLCQVDHLDSVCNPQCRRRQRGILQFVCDQKRARLSMTYRNGSQADISLEEISVSLQVLDLHTQDYCTLDENMESRPVYLVKTNGRGFLGVYSPEPEMLYYFLSSNESRSASPNVWQLTDSSGKTSKGASRAKVQLQQPSNHTLKMTFTGILNPTACLRIHDIVMFIVSKEHYPVYDVNNLYNTNSQFDWGGFRRLAEEAKLGSGSPGILLFFYQFHEAGTYVLRLSSNQHKRMYIRVMPYGGQCYEEGPFFPTTPRHVVQVGIAKIPDLTLKPDWRAITGIILGLLVLLVIFLLLMHACQVLGWSRKGNPCSRFRRLQLKYNLDKYSSKGSTVITVRKSHPALQERSLDQTSSHMEKREGKCGTWDTEEQIDLDSFNTSVFFEILLTQSLAVTAKLSQYKEEVPSGYSAVFHSAYLQVIVRILDACEWLNRQKVKLKMLYHKLLDETASLRDFWVARMCLPNCQESCDDAVLRNYTIAKEQAEEEILRRRSLAAEYEESVSRQLGLLNQDLKSQEEHWVTFNSALREAMRLTETLMDTLSSEEGLSSGSQLEHQRLLALIDAANSRMSSAIIKDSHRLKLWGVLADGLGGHLVSKEKNRSFTKEELVGPDGLVKADEVLHQDVTTGLIEPSLDAVVLLGNQTLKPVSTGHFLHRDTGKVLPVAGNVGYDPVTSNLVPVVDFASGEIHRSVVPILPYVPYPICPSTGLPVKTNLPILQPEKLFKLGGLMNDPATEIEVPVLAMTVHPQTGQKLALGGTYLNPLTGTVTPLEMGGPMRVPEGGRIVPILGVSLDNNTGDVVPLGGLLGPSESLLLIGDSFTEPLSGKTGRVQGVCLQQDKMVPHAGGYQAVLEASLLVAQINVVRGLRDYKDSIWEDVGSAGEAQKVLKAAQDDMISALCRVLEYSVYWRRHLEKLRDLASGLKSSGGKLGMIKYPGTELWIPAVFGMNIPDPGGSDLMVPILGVECDWKTGQPIPLAGTMEDADGKGLAPLAVGFRTIDPITGETGPVIGAQINPWTNAVIPLVQLLGSLPRGNPDPDLGAALEKEMAAKQAYWVCQREKEEELLKELDFLLMDILDAAKERKMKKVRYRDKLKPAEVICRSLEESSAQEIQRRANRDLNTLWDTEQSLQSKADKDERGQEARVMLLLKKMLEKLVHFIRKVQLEEGRIQMQLKEAERQWNKTFLTEEALQEKSRKSTVHLVAEFQEHIAKQQTSLESAYCRLEYLRYLSDTQTLQTKDLLSGSLQCFVNYPGMRFYSVSGAPHGTWEVINQKLIPLLKSVVHALEDSKRSALSPEMLLGLASGEGYSSRSTMKVSEAPGEAFRTETRQEVVPAARLSPTSHSSLLSNRSQLLQEIQTRIFIEKHASEMAHLQLSLLEEEANMISCFCESSRLKKSLGMGRSQGPEADGEWGSLLKELAEYHRHTEMELHQQHWEEIKCAGLNPDGLTLKDGTLFSPEEIRQHLMSLGADLQKADCAQETSETQSDTSTVPLKVETLAVKIVKLEALKQLWISRVLDYYLDFQRQTCPEDVLQALNSFCDQVTRETVAREVATLAETEQVERVKSFLRKHHEGKKPLIQVKDVDDAETRKLAVLIQRELQVKIEEKLKAKEVEGILEAAKNIQRRPAEHLAHFLLTQRHLQQTVQVLAGGLQLQRAGLGMQSNDNGTEAPALDARTAFCHMRGSLDIDEKVEAELEAVLQQVRDKKGPEHSVLELKQAVKVLQLRERQFQEVIQLLQRYSCDKHLEDANQIASELQDFRQQKIRELGEQLRACSTTGGPSQIQCASPLLGKEGQEGKGKKWEDFHDRRLAELEESYRGQISEEKAKLQDQLERGDIKGWMKQKLLREHDETVTFLDKVFHQDLGKLRGRLEKERKKRRCGWHNSRSPTSEAAPSQGRIQPGLVEDRVLGHLADTVKILKQTELLVLLRTALLNPRFRPLLSDGDEAGSGTSSQLLLLLKEVNHQFQKCAAATGLLDVHQPDQDAVNSFQDIMALWVTPKPGELVILSPPSLSAREFIIYQYGTVILKFLRPHTGAPEIELIIASSIPSSYTPGNAFRNTFYYQHSGNQLFVLRECLACVGGFTLLLVHSLAHITTGDFGQDSSPAFQRLFYQALKACLGELFSLRLQTSAVLEDSKTAARMMNEAFLKREVITDEKINLLSELFAAKVKPSADSKEKQREGLLLHTEFEDLLKSIMSEKAKGCYSSILPESQKTFSMLSSPEGSCPHPTPGAAEDKLDVLTEKLVQLLEKKQQVLQSATYEDLLVEELEAIGLERDSVLKEMELLEGKLRQARGTE